MPKSWSNQTRVKVMEGMREDEKLERSVLFRNELPVDATSDTI